MGNTIRVPLKCQDANTLTEQFWETIAPSRGLCESPIEAMFFDSFIRVSRESGFRLTVGHEENESSWWSDPVLDYGVFASVIYKTGWCESATIIPQKHIGEFRADFEITIFYFDAFSIRGFETPNGRQILYPGVSRATIVVECDGHEFHERTKEQAARDKSRDRFFQSIDYKVLRFSGSEIFKNSDGCAAEVLSTVSRQRFMVIK